MRKQYFGKNKENYYPIYVVKLLTDEINRFASHMSDYGFDKFQDLPEIMDCKDNEYAIAYTLKYGEEKNWFELAYKEYKEKYYSKNKEV